MPKLILNGKEAILLQSVLQVFYLKKKYHAQELVSDPFMLEVHQIILDWLYNILMGILYKT